MLIHGEINVWFGAYRRSDYGHCTVYTGTYLTLLLDKCTCIHCDSRDLDYTSDMSSHFQIRESPISVGSLPCMFKVGEVFWEVAGQNVVGRALI